MDIYPHNSGCLLKIKVGKKNCFKINSAPTGLAERQKPVGTLKMVEKREMGDF